eukprot:CAMPEP_0180436438 /NCGR_PEP_ID=MMETSP1036_2-20121128/11021_1 /TAXON_ID=632150 /ORGANISM="Azadinium spinosum, Strain 3D9" /LENGTH=35 /DNA_ID= /DNA_START= /DNA_END= /DNA_ORIENTATION=
MTCPTGIQPSFPNLSFNPAAEACSGAGGAGGGGGG